jgi:hypothetical protein
MDAPEMASSPVGSWAIQFLGAEGRPVADMGEADLYEAVADSAINVTSLGIPAAMAWRRPSDAGAAEAAVEILRCDAARWWHADWRERPQIWLGEGARPPEPQDQRAPASGKPRAAIWTSSAVAGLPSGWWPYFVGRAPVELTAWQLSLQPEVRVFEIRSPQDFWSLCQRFGMRKDKRGLLHPDWDAVGVAYDGVHLTVAGLISTQGVLIQRDPDPVMLWGWDVECTAWLRWPVVAATRSPVRSELADRGHSGARRHP